MTNAPQTADAQPPGFGWVIGLVVICTLIEAILQAGDFGLAPVPRLRNAAYEFGAFWPGLLSDWQPNYPAQPVLMFLTYAFLHGGLLHLAMNMVTLLSLGRWVVEQVGATGFVLIYFGSSVLGAALFAALALPSTPMVGASGALFGLAGAIVYWVATSAPGRGRGLIAALRIALFLIVLNIVLYFAFHGRVAWQTHLGGALAGFAIAWGLAQSRALRGR